MPIILLRWKIHISSLSVLISSAFLYGYEMFFKTALQDMYCAFSRTMRGRNPLNTEHPESGNGG
jgi:hypothetical protein